MSQGTGVALLTLAAVGGRETSAMIVPPKRLLAVIFHE